MKYVRSFIDWVRLHLRECVFVFLFGSLVLGFCCYLISCDIPVSDLDPDPASDLSVDAFDNYDCVLDYVDPVTGVHYLIYSRKYMNAGFGGITVRYNADGSIMVDEVLNSTSDLECSEVDSND